MASQQVLLVDADPQRSAQLATVLEFVEYQVATVLPTDSEQMLSELGAVELVFIGYGGDKLASIVSMFADKKPSLPIVLVVDRGSASQLPTAVEKVAALILEWPTTHQIFMESIRKCRISNEAIRQGEQRRSVNLFRSLAGESKVIQATRKLIQQVADSDATVLVLGESGTGKEVVARNLHYYSSRKTRPFVPVNCGAIPAELLESELFGHEKGAFTGALTARQGRFELAEGGTLFLDEIGDMPLTMQVKLLRVLQERTFERVGSNRTIECDVRIIAATHRHLETEIRENRFREDLYYRLNVFPIELPPLRERVDDIPVLVGDLIARIENEKRGSVRLTSSAFQSLKQYSWPGNVRELANLVERLAILNPYGVADAVDLPEKFQLNGGSEVKQEASGIGDWASRSDHQHLDDESQTQIPEAGIDLKEHLSNLECDLIRRALDECNGVVAHAAKRLKMRRTTLVEKLRKYGLQRGEEVSTL